MKIEAYSETDARLLVKQIYGYDEDQYKISIVKKPADIFWGLIKKKGIYKIAIMKSQKNANIRKNLRLKVNGSAEIKDGILKVINPKHNGRYPSIISDDPNIEVFMNGKKIEGPNILTEKDIIELRPKILEPDTKVLVEVSKDKMQASLKIHKKKGKKFYVEDTGKGVSIKIRSSFNEIEPQNVTYEECIKALKNANVKTEFIDTEAVNELINMPAGSTIVVARGKDMIEGVKTEINYYFTESEQDDRMDIPVVQIGDVLAAKLMPALPGRDGVTVTGEVVKAAEVEDIFLKAGEGTILLDNETKAVASISGRPVIRDGIISVIPLLVIPGDIDKYTGDIDFDGDIIVKGNVMDNMKVIAKGKIKVSGSIFNSKVVSYDDININGKVIGGKIIAGMNMANYYCIAPLIEKIMKIINGLIEQTKSSGQTGIQAVLRKIYYENDAIKKCIEEIKKMFPLMEDDDIDKLSYVLDKVKESLSYINTLHISDSEKLRELYNELTQYIDSIRNLYMHNVNITLNYAQNATVQACGDIIVTGEGSYQSNLIAKDSILYKGQRNYVKGGMLIAGKYIKAGTIGSNSGIHTYCRVLEKDGKVNAYIYNGTIINIHDNVQAT